MIFDIIYSFEVMEHVPRDRLETFFRNIYNHMNRQSVFVGSFTTTKSKKHPKHHQTIMSKTEWRSFIEKMRLFEIIDLKWKPKQYLRNSYN